VLRNIGSNWVLILVTVAATYILTPFIIETLGQEGYGTWTLITAITGYVGLLALGVPMASVRYLAEHVAEGDVKKMNATIGSCAGLYLAIGGTAILVGGVLMGLFAVYEIPGPLKQEARFAFALMVLHVSAGFIGLLPEGILFSHHASVPRNVIRVSGVLLRLGLTYLLLVMSASLMLLALVQILCLAFDFAMTWLIVRRRYPETRISLADFDLAVVKRIFSFSVYVLLLNAGARLVFETDALVIGAMLGVGAIPFYVVANSFAVYLMDFVIAIAAVVSPMATKLRTERRPADLVEMFLKWSKVALSLTLMAGIFLIVFGARFIGWWIDPSYERPSGEVLQILMVSSFLFLPVRGVAVPVLMGLGKPKIPAVASLGAGLLNLVMSLVLVVPFGLAGVAIGTAIPNVIFALVVLTVTCRELGITVADYVRYVVPRAFVGALPPLLLLLWFRLGLQVQSFAGMAAAGTAMTVVFTLTWIFYVYRRDPYVDLRPHFVRIRVWSRA
jgi:O-antigen/teichoic acid export membrane protein